MKGYEARLADELRRVLHLPSIAPDAWVLEATEGTFSRARAEFGLAWADLKAEVRRALRAMLRGA